MFALDRQSLQELAMTRLDDARVLIENHRYAAAYYLAGYVVECGLKACIAKQTREFEFPDKERVTKSWVHKLENLIQLTQIPTNNGATDFSADPILKRNWAVVRSGWSPDKRYENKSEREARDLLRAIDDPEHGVLQWLQKYW